MIGFLMNFNPLPLLRRMRAGLFVILESLIRGTSGVANLYVIPATPNLPWAAQSFLFTFHAPRLEQSERSEGAEVA